MNLIGGVDGAHDEADHVADKWLTFNGGEPLLCEPGEMTTVMACAHLIKFGDEDMSSPVTRS